ncbi:LysR family transcriptional regulator [Bosea sp. (in: a-proteobacteria)]|uniref:LysR family transcriptional regulator n=1 Tax=Bosea sp. (in: a-proteobacteria) TaxID=1871050 RepID=UPI002609C276|nr:LysR family transcriptional regulator [Bosea sp. (in: a-proteobacteria)]MCO5089781.1 LysR family transcriptional regulator [Bosea sp. (in: a-proteobacteria)]
MNEMLDVHSMQAFVALAEELHFTKAARRLGTTQPAFSVLIRRLEETVGARLVERTTRQVNLTEAGQQFLDRTRLALSQMDEAVKMARLAASGARGRLSIGLIQSALYLGFPEAIRLFRAQNPDIEVVLSHLGSPEQIQALKEGRIDIGILRPSGSDTELHFETAVREDFALAAPADHPALRKPVITLAELADEPFIHYQSAAGDIFPQFVAPYCRRAGFEPRFVADSDTTAVMLCLVAAHVGIAIVPSWVQHIAPPAIACRPIPEIPAMVELTIAYQPDTASPFARAFVTTLKQIIAASSRSPQRGRGLEISA